MTTDEMEGFGKSNNYSLFKEYYANQYYGALNWISKSGGSFINEFTSTKNALNETSIIKIQKLRGKLEFLNKAQNYSNKDIKKDIKHIIVDFSIKLFFDIIIKLWCRLVTNYYQMMANLEWNYFRHRKNGSEMFLFFKKTNRK